LKNFPLLSAFGWQLPKKVLAAPEAAAAVTFAVDDHDLIDLVT
jgi:hypothetical protein